MCKDVTYESLTDEAFIDTARRAFPDLAQLHAEYDAAASVDEFRDQIGLPFTG